MIERLRELIGLVLKQKREQSPCAFDPMVYENTPMGMFRCPDCGEMVIAGLPHPPYHEEEVF